MADEWEDRVDVVSRGLLGLTVACARCHDHKFDPIPTEDYYALAGVFASTEMYNQPLDDSVETGKDGQAKKAEQALHIVRDGDKPADLNIFVRGNVDQKGPVAPRRFLTVLGPDGGSPEPFDTEGSGRDALADSVAGRRKPPDGSRLRQPRLGAQLRPSPGRHAQQLRRAGRTTDPS